jgi:hypothetical protein
MVHGLSNALPSFPKLSRCPILAVWASVLGAPMSAQLVPHGTDFQVNTETTQAQSAASVAGLGEVGYVVVWNSTGGSPTDPSGTSVHGQRYTNAGLPIGGQFQLNTFTTGEQNRPDVGADASGNFVVVWHSTGSTGSDGSGRSIQARRYLADGTPLGAEFQVNDHVTGDQSSPSVAVDPSGSFVVVWGSASSPGNDTDLSLQGRRFDAGGAPIAPQFQVNSYTTGAVSDADLAKFASGGFVITWTRGAYPTDTDLMDIRAQRYDATGSPAGSEFTVNELTTSYQYFPAVAVLPGDRFVVVWTSFASDEIDVSASSIRARTFDAAGAPLTGDFEVNQSTTGYQHQPAVARVAGGDFVLAWGSDSSAGTDTSNQSVQIRRYAADGTPRGGEFQLNSHTTLTQAVPAIGADARGNFLASWQSLSSPGDDSDSQSILARRFDGLFRDGFETNDLSRWSATAP